MLMLPTLREYADGLEHRYRDVRERLAIVMGVSAEDLAELVPSGGNTRFSDRASWAHVYLRQAGILQTSRRGVYQITPRGQEILAHPPDKITMKFLEQYPEYREFRARKSTTSVETVAPTPVLAGEESQLGTLTPDEQIRAGHQLLRANLASQLLERVRLVSPLFFERLVVKLLVEMGYGGSYADAAQVVGKSGDGGIDGIIKEDRLGLESIYVQAKRWQSTV